MLFFWVTERNSNITNNSHLMNIPYAEGQDVEYCTDMISFHHNHLCLFRDSVGRTLKLREVR